MLGVSDRPAVFSRSGSFEFNREEATERIRRVAPNVENCPVLRIAKLRSTPRPLRNPILCFCSLMDWAVNIVRLPLKPGAHDDLLEQTRAFAPEFMLFVPHVHKLDLVTGSSEPLRVLHLTTADGVVELSDGQSSGSVDDLRKVRTNFRKLRATTAGRSMTQMLSKSFWPRR